MLILLQDSLENLVLIIGFLFITTMLFRHPDYTLTLRQRIGAGLLQGTFGMIFIYFGFRVEAEFLLDFRQLPILLAAHTGGAVGALAAGAVIAAYRLFLDSNLQPASLISVMSIVVTAVSAGLVTRHVFRYRIRWLLMTGCCIAAEWISLALVMPERMRFLIPFYCLLIAVGALFCAGVYYWIGRGVDRLEMNKTASVLLRAFSERRDQDLYQVMMDEVLELLECRYGSIISIDHQRYMMVSRSRVNTVLSSPQELEKMDVEALVIAETGEPLLFSNWNLRRPSGRLERRMYEDGIRSSLHVPVIYKDRVIALINAASHRPGQFTSKHLRLLTQITPLISFGLSLLDAENIVSAIGQSTQDAIIIADSEMRMISWNHGAERLFGYRREEVIGRDVCIIIPAEYQEAHKRGVERFRNTGAGEVVGSTVELMALRKDGTTLPVEFSLNCWQTGGLLFFSSIIRDITERKQIEAEIRESEAKFRALFGNANDMIFLADYPENTEPGLCLEVNDAACEALGYTRDELLQKTVNDLSVNDEEFRAGYHHVVALLNREGSATFEWRLRAKGGRVLYCECNAKLIKLGDRNASINILRDISERKEAEAAIRESEARYRRLVDLSPELIAVHTEGVIVFINETGARMLGFSDPAEAVGERILQFVHPNYRDMVSARASQMYQHQERVELVEEQFLSRDGRVIDVQVQGSNIIYQGKPSAMVMALDITERKRSVTALRESEERYRKLVELSPDAVCVYQGSRIVFANERAADIFGVSSAAELVGADALQFLHPAYAEDVVRMTRELYEKRGSVNRQELVYLTAHGREITLEASATAIQEQGRPALFTTFRDISERKAAERQLQEANRILQQLSTLDGLTGIPNRRFFEEMFEKEWKDAVRSGASLTVILCDIDYFKAYNDTYGHQGGDACLKAVAERFSEELHRPRDFAARYGGEEFVILLPETGREGAAQVAERVELLGIPHQTSRTGEVVTVSIGTATMIPHPLASRQELLGLADKALYQAKLEGRNRVISSGEGGSIPEESE